MKDGEVDNECGRQRGQYTVSNHMLCYTFIADFIANFIAYFTAYVIVIIGVLGFASWSRFVVFCTHPSNYKLKLDPEPS